VSGDLIVEDAIRNCRQNGEKNYPRLFGSRWGHRFLYFIRNNRHPANDVPCTFATSVGLFFERAHAIADNAYRI